MGEIIAHQSDDNGHEMMVKVGDAVLYDPSSAGELVCSWIETSNQQWFVPEVGIST